VRMWTEWVRLEQSQLRRIDASIDHLREELLNGRVSIAELMDSEHRRYYCLRVNAAAVAEQRCLTQRQCQILCLMLQGRSNKFIALTLELSLSSVATHIARAKQKLGGTAGLGLFELLHTDAMSKAPPPQ
jgi:DNA-binding NarL/FixJ family response regulator